MVGYIVRRTLWIVPVLFAVSLITFSLMHLVPGGPWDNEKELPDATIRLLNSKYGLDDPVPVQYLNWIGGMLTGDLGPSYRFPNRTVNDILFDGLGPTLQLGGMAFVLSVAVGVPLGILAALRQNGIPDYIATGVSLVGIATPTFVLATLLVITFSVGLGWFPTGGWRGPEYWILPTIALAGVSIAQIARFTRASMLDVTRSDYVRTAHSKGVRKRAVVTVHMLRNALIPVVTILGPLLAALLTGSFVIELLFSVPGIGRLFITSIAQRDYGVIMATTMLFATAVVVMNLVVDVLYAVIDPRIRYS